MKKSTGLPVLVALSALLLSGGYSTAQADGLYFGAGAYLNEAKIRELEETDEGLALLLGYKTIDSNVFMLSFELGFHDLGEFSSDGEEVELDAISLSVVPALPLGPFIELYGKLGVAEMGVEVNGRSFDGTETMYGVGIALDFFDTVDLYLEYLEFDTEVDSSTVGIGIKIDLF